jgi:hypothetical protein
MVNSLWEIYVKYPRLDIGGRICRHDLGWHFEEAERALERKRPLETDGIGEHETVLAEEPATGARGDAIHHIDGTDEAAAHLPHHAEGEPWQVGAAAHGDTRRIFRVLLDLTSAVPFACVEENRAANARRPISVLDILPAKNDEPPPGRFARVIGVVRGGVDEGGMVDMKVLWS